MPRLISVTASLWLAVSFSAPGPYAWTVAKKYFQGSSPLATNKPEAIGDFTLDQLQAKILE